MRSRSGSASPHTDWVEGGWTTAETVELSRRLKALGVDLIDVSSGGLDPAQKIALGQGYQVPGAEAVKTGAGIAVAAVGMITEPVQAQAILTEGKADLILLARGLLRDPYWPIHAASVLGRHGRAAGAAAIRARLGAAGEDGAGCLHRGAAGFAVGGPNSACVSIREAS